MARIGSEILQASQAIIQNFQQQQQQQLAAISLEANIKQAKKNFQLQEEEFRLREEGMQLREEQMRQTLQQREQTEARLREELKLAQDKFKAGKRRRELDLEMAEFQAKFRKAKGSPEEQAKLATEIKRLEKEKAELDVQLAEQDVSGGSSGTKKLPATSAFRAGNEFTAKARKAAERDLTTKVTDPNEVEFQGDTVEQLEEKIKRWKELKADQSSIPGRLLTFAGAPPPEDFSAKIKTAQALVVRATDHAKKLLDTREFMEQQFQEQFPGRPISLLDTLMQRGVEPASLALRRFYNVPDGAASLSPAATLDAFEARDFGRLYSLAESRLVKVNSDGTRTIIDENAKVFLQALQNSGSGMPDDEFRKFASKFGQALLTGDADLLNPIGP